VINILLRNSAARCIGNISGPKISRRCGRLHAGWCALNVCPAGSNTVPSEAERFLPRPLGFPGVVLMGLNFILEGESSNESVSP
jgi:hypothetical protein